MKRNFRWLGGLITLLMLGALLAACGGGAATPAAAPTAAPAAAAPTAAPEATAAPAAAAATAAPEATAAPADAATAMPAATAAPAEAATAAPAAAGAGGNLQIIWFAWQPCQALGELVKGYKDATVEVRCVPIAQWHDQIFTDFAAKGGADITILDSQFIGEAVKGGHIMELTDWMNAPGNFEKDDFIPAALAAYGEYPAGSGKYYGVPAEGDTMMLVYRKDVFANQKLKDAFKAKTGKELALPTKWTDLLAIAQFIKANPDVAGVKNGYTTFWCGTQACYDQVATVWNQMAWSWGGEIWDPKTYKIDGIMNSDTNVKALQFAADLFKTGPDGSGNFQFNETVDALCSGSTAMTTIWFGFGAAFVDKTGCKQSDNLGYALAPGEVKHVTSLGGMGLHVSSYTKNKDASLAFVKWFESKDTQIAWAKLGGFTARKSVLTTPEFQNATPYNPVFAQAYLDVKDFWNIPEYNKMLPIQMEQLNLAITGQADPKESLDSIAKDQQAIIDEAYPDGPPK